MGNKAGKEPRERGAVARNDKKKSGEKKKEGDAQNGQAAAAVTAEAKIATPATSQKGESKPKEEKSAKTEPGKKEKEKEKEQKTKEEEPEEAPEGEEDGEEDAPSEAESAEAALLDDDEMWFGKTEEAKKPQKNVSGKKAEDFYTGNGSAGATERLIRDLNVVMGGSAEEFGYSAEPIDDNLYNWEVRLSNFDADSDLSRDLKQYAKGAGEGQDYVLLNMVFPSNYPFAPPFVRVMKPRFVFHTGNVTIGGSICMELLTRSGWTPTNDIESALVQIRAQFVEGNGRIDFGNPTPYTETEAKVAFHRVAKQHGWEE